MLHLAKFDRMLGHVNKEEKKHKRNDEAAYRKESTERAHVAASVIDGEGSNEIPSNERCLSCDTYRGQRDSAV